VFGEKEEKDKRKKKETEKKKDRFQYACSHIIVVARNFVWRGPKIRAEIEDRGVYGAECHPPKLTMDLGEAPLPWSGPEPGPKFFLVHLELERTVRTHLIVTNLIFVTFWQYIFSHIHIHNILNIILHLSMAHSQNDCEIFFPRPIGAPGPSGYAYARSTYSNYRPSRPGRLVKEKAVTTTSHCLAVDLPWHDVTSVAEGCFILQPARPDRPTDRAQILPGLHQSFDDVDISNLLTDLSQPIS